MNLYDIHPDPENAPYREWAFDNIPELVYVKYRGEPEELKKRENVLATSAWYSYTYASMVLKGPFPAGEAAMAKDSGYAYYYARGVLKGPFPAGEAAIAAHTWYSYNYAISVLGGPFPAGEAAIAQATSYAYIYALDILKLPDAAAALWYVEREPLK